MDLTGDVNLTGEVIYDFGFGYYIYCACVFSQNFFKETLGFPKKKFRLNYP